jgi:hypothetical protein
MSTRDQESEKQQQENRKSTAKDLPAAGPHDKKELQDPMKTPGTGSLPEVGSRGGDVGPD